MKFLSFLKKSFLKTWFWVALASLVFVYLFVSVYIWQYNQISAEPISAWLQDHKADCAVVLTGGPGRVREGFDLLSQGQVRKLIVAGVNPKATLREIFPQWPYHGQIFEENVILERRSETTYGNAVQSLPLVELLRCRDLVLVTSHLHMWRAFRTFNQVFPPDIHIHKRALTTGSFPPRAYDVHVEVLKSLFYSIWAY